MVFVGLTFMEGGVVAWFIRIICIGIIMLEAGVSGVNIIVIRIITDGFILIFPGLGDALDIICPPAVIAAE
jgi:hypothetical protein